MTTTRIRRWLTGGAQVALALLWVSTAWAQTFSSGSTGADGAFAPTATTTLALPPDGVFNFTTVTIPAGVTVSFTPNSANTPVTILATGDVTVAGTLSVSGANGAAPSSSGPVVNAGGAGGPGGFAGGNGGARGGTSAPSAGQGPGGGAAASVSAASSAAYGAPISFVTLLPLFGGSGGGGGNGDAGATLAGGSGGGGGGALVIASSTKLVVTGVIRANGGNGGTNTVSSCTVMGGAGSGGAIRLVAPQVTGGGTIQATGGTTVCTGTGGSGRIRLEAFALGFSGTSTPAASVSAAPGPVTTASNPALVNLPTLSISSVGGVAVPANPGGSYTAADVSLPQGTTNPVPVTLTASNIPVGTIFTVRLIPQAGNSTTVSSGSSTGTFSSSTATANVTFPSGQVSVLNASASFTLPALVAGLYPLIDGEPVERVMVAAAYGEPSKVTLITRSGKEIPAEQVLQGVR